MEIWQRSFCGPQILGHPAADGRVIGCYWTRYWKTGKLEMSDLQIFWKMSWIKCFLCKILWEQEIWHHDSCWSKKYEIISLLQAEMILLICPIWLFVQFSYDLVSSSRLLTTNSCRCDVTSGKVQGSELVLICPLQGRSFWGINVSMRVARSVLSWGQSGGFATVLNFGVFNIPKKNSNTHSLSWDFRADKTFTTR